MAQSSHGTRSRKRNRKTSTPTSRRPSQSTSARATRAAHVRNRKRGTVVYGVLSASSGVLAYLHNFFLAGKQRSRAASVRLYIPPSLITLLQHRYQIQPSSRYDRPFALVASATASVLTKLWNYSSQNVCNFTHNSPILLATASGPDL